MTLEIAMHKNGEVSEPDACSYVISPMTLQRIISLVGESQTNQEILRQVIDKVLSTYGQPIMTTILLHLRARGVISMLGAKIDILMFHNALRQITGDLAEMISVEICADLERAFNEHTMLHGNLANNC